MNIDDKGRFDAEVCENIPLHFTNQVQSYGFLLVTDHDLQVIQWSESFPAFFGLEREEFEGKDLREFLVMQHYQEIKKKIADKKIQDHIPMDLIFSTVHKTVHFKALLHIKAEYLLLELEETEPQQVSSFAKLYQEIKYISAILKVAGSTEDICQKAAENLKVLSGFDRVMIYCFDDEWNGEVVGEALATGMVPYKGFHFPSSDIPKQARLLYLKNPYRMIPDVMDEAQPLVPTLNKANKGITDLSDCNLRSVAQVHLDYLKNMGVQASMSVPIIKDQQLWGLIACHHQLPKHLPYEMRSSFELLSTIISEQITARQTKSLLERRIALFDQLGSLVKFMSERNDFVQGLIGGTVNLLSLFNISGAVVMYEKEYHVLGETPPRHFVEGLMDWHKKAHASSIYSSHHLPLDYEPAKEHAQLASGAILLPLALERKYYIAGFRKEYIEQVKWAGDPNFAQGLPNQVDALHPRNSFSLFQETKRFHSRKWEKLEIDIAETLLKATLEIILKAQVMKRLIAEEEAYQLSIVAQKTANSVITLNKEGRVEWVNEAFSTLSGHELKELTGKTLNEILHSNGHLEDVSQLLGQIGDNGQNYKREILIQKDGKDFYLNFNFSRVKHEDGEQEKIIAIGSDFTAIKEKSIALEQINEQLDKYTYIVSHDLKAPLKGIEGLLNVLEENIEEGNCKDNNHIFSMMREATARMDGFISSMLTQAKGQRTQAEELDVNLLLAETIQWLNADNAKVKILVDKDMPTIHTNRVQLQQVFSNLLSNAIRYGCPDKGICLIEVGVALVKEKSIQFYVKDNGKGIAPEFHQRIFHLYDTGKEKGSSGIGLYTIKSILDEIGGKIWVESELGKGATFRFEWPIV